MPYPDTDNSTPAALTLGAVREAAARIATYVRVTPVLYETSLNERTGAQLEFKAEHLQRGGAFKLRGACNALGSLDPASLEHGVITHSSGNHGLAVALAAADYGVTAHIVVPEGAIRAKLARIEAAGAVIHRCAPSLAAREAMVAELLGQTGAHLIHPYADPAVIAGQGTVTLELLQQMPDIEALVVPVGGGGLAAGAAIVAAALRPGLKLYLAEPSGAADTALSLQRGERVLDIQPETVCDGLRATLGAPNFKILHAYGAQALTVTDAETLQAMRLLWMELKQVIEPSSATVLAAVLRYREYFQARRVGLVLSGGNVDLDALPFHLA